MITGIILSHNNEDTIVKTIASLSFCDECIVIDDESTDDTVKRARKAGATVYIHPLANDFSGQRNFGLSKAGEPWALFVDSDEEVTEALAKEIHHAVKNEEGMQGFFIRRTDLFFGKPLRYGETAHVSLLRVGKVAAGKWVRAVHEIWEISGTKKTLTTPLVHIPHPTLKGFIAKVERYSTLNAKVFHKEGKRTNVMQIIWYPVAKFILNYFQPH